MRCFIVTLKDTPESPMAFHSLDQVRGSLAITCSRVPDKMELVQAEEGKNTLLNIVGKGEIIGHCVQTDIYNEPCHL